MQTTKVSKPESKLSHTSSLAPELRLLSAVALLSLAAASSPALAQSRTCIIDEDTWQLRCGALADERGNRIPDRPVYAPAPVPAPIPMPLPVPVIVAPTVQPAPTVIVRPAPPVPRNSYDERQAFEQQRMEVQERVNSLFLDVLGRDADITTLRRVAGQVMEGRQLADVRIELATSSEARTAINQIYRDVLRRDADPSGLNAQMAGLRSGLTLAQIRQAIADSPEGRARR